MSVTPKDRLKDLPKAPGLYFYKDKTGETIYIGKAANLRNRVRQYFQKSRIRDPKTDALIAEIASLQWRELDSEADALFLEAELVRRYQPRYNIMLRDDKSLLYVRIDYDSDYPTVITLRRPLDDGARYFGPYLSGYAVKKALRYLRRAYPYAEKRPLGAKRAGLHYHLGLDPGLEDGRTTLAEYRSNLRKLMRYMKGEGAALIRQADKEMKRAAKVKDFETAARARNQLFALKSLDKQILFGDRENLDLTLDEALNGLAQFVGLKEPPRRIECYDISHFAGREAVASMVVFTNGVPDKTAYRKFKMSRSRNDDTANLKEVITRRFGPRNLAKWPLPQLMVIDGGKGQLTAGLSAKDAVGQQSIPAIGLAKRFEEVIVKRQGGYELINLPDNSPVLKLLQRIRDESHRFAVAYHETLARRRQIASLLEEIPGIGPATRKRLIRRFGSARAVTQASQDQLIEVLGTSQGRLVYQYFQADRQPAKHL
jgi:excinuclease ABC subunit C